MKVVFLSGTYIQAPDGKAEVRPGPGSCAQLRPPSSS
jgi:hypothetical protein